MATKHQRRQAAINCQIKEYEGATTLHLTPEWLLLLATFVKEQTQSWGGKILRAQTVGLLDCIVLIETQSLNARHEIVLTHRAFWLSNEWFLTDRIHVVRDAEVHIFGDGDWPQTRKERAQRSYDDFLCIAIDKFEGELWNGD